MGEDRGGGAGGGEMGDFLAFRCNFTEQGGKACSAILSEGWVTSCSHLICMQHAKEWFESNDDCPVCRNGAARLLRVDLSQAMSKRRRCMSLVGMTPPEIMQASETALNFWLDQKVFEFQQDAKRQTVLGDRYKKTEELVKERLVESENACNGLQEERRVLELRIEEAERDNSKAENQLRELERELTAAEEEYRSLHSRVSHGDFRAFFRRSLHDSSPMPGGGMDGRAGTPAARSRDGGGGAAASSTHSRMASTDAGSFPSRGRQAWHHQGGTPRYRSDAPMASPGGFLPHRSSASKGAADRRGGSDVVSGAGGSDDHSRGEEGGRGETARRRGDGNHGSVGAHGGLASALGGGGCGGCGGCGGGGGGPCRDDGGMAGRFGSSLRRLPTFTPGMSYGAGRFAKKRNMKA